MPIIKSAKKQMRQDIKRRKKNAVIKNDIKSAWRKFVKNPSRELLKTVQSEFDKAVKKGYIKKNTAARRKALAAKMAKAHAGITTTTDKVAKAPVKAVKPTTKPAAKKPTTAKKPVAKKPATKAPTKKPAAKKPVTTKKPTTKK